MGGSSSFGGPSGVGVGGGPPGMGGEGKAGSGANAPPISPLRYIDVSEQVRRLPVGLVLVVDQAYVPEVLTAMANSRLQMWTTQVHWRHVSGVTAPDAGSLASGSPAGSGSRDDEGKPMGPGFGPGFGKPPGLGGPGPHMGGSSGGLPPTFGSGFGKPPPGYPGTGPGPMGGGASDPGNAGALSQEDPNLVELAVYAIASLYEQPPAEKKDPAAAPTNGQPMGPPMGAPMGEPMGQPKMP
jgi:hypothetical protein